MWTDQHRPGLTGTERDRPPGGQFRNFCDVGMCQIVVENLRTTIIQIEIEAERH